MRQRARHRDGGHSTIYCPKKVHTPEGHSLSREKGEQNTDFLEREGKNRERNFSISWDFTQKPKDPLPALAPQLEQL